MMKSQTYEDSIRFKTYLLNFVSINIGIHSLIFSLSEPKGLSTLFGGEQIKLLNFLKF
jgi:hypothetical protein